MKILRSNTLLSSALGTIFVQGTSAGLLFFLSLALARTLGQEGFGAYEYADAWIEVLILFSMLGFDRLLIRYVAEFQQREDWGLLIGIFRYARKRIVLFALIVIPVVGLIITFALGNQSNGFIIVTTFWIALVLLPLRVILKLNQVTLQGLRRTVFAYLPDYVLRPAILLVGLILLARTPQEAMLFHIGAAIGALVISLVFIKRFLPEPAKLATPETNTQWMQTAFPFMLISGIAMLNLRGGTTLVGLIADLETVALYGVAVRASGIMSLALAAVSAVVAPRIARLYSAENVNALQALVTRSTRGITVIALCVLFLFIVAGDKLLFLFGPQYGQAYVGLIILGLGQFVNASTGVVGWILMMTGHEIPLLKISLFSTSIHYLLIIILLPILGLEGAMIGTAVGNALGNILMAIFTYRNLKINSTFL